MKLKKIVSKLIKLTNDHYVIVDDSEKMTHSTNVFDEHNLDLQQISLQEVKELIGEVDVVEELAEKAWGNSLATKGHRIGFKYGYNQALEDNKEKKYTEEDMKNALFYALNHPKEDGVISITRDSIVRKSIQSLQPKTEWEIEIIDGKLKLK